MKNQIGNIKDVLKAWKKLYQLKGWKRFGKFNSKGGFNTPYVLYKAKNVVDPKKREDKVHKARPAINLILAITELCKATILSGTDTFLRTPSTR